ncbi:pectate lyase family protein [Horticoccus sp. 23ND18S-11]|uniref:pectate lyase n=1 Tax=Horticoccus sp. 23ND18S-11 TaxID=3391832 RepID=UPI0039C96C06
MPALRFLLLVLLATTALGGADAPPRWLTLDAAARRDSVDAPASRLVAPGPNGKLSYRAEPDGTTLPDFSTCGFAGGGVALPVAAVKVTLSPEAGGADDRPRIQAAIDEVSRLPRDAQGLRGAVLLRRGAYRVHGTLRIAASGVVLRGEGPGTDGTVITATLPKKHTVIDVGGDGDLERDESTRLRVTDAYVPVGARLLQVERAGVFHVGDTVLVHRPSPREWIAALGMDRLAEGTKKPGVKNWSPGGFDLLSDRTVVAMDGAIMTLDAPVFQALEARFGGATVVRYRDPGRIERAGVEALRIVSVYDRKKFKAASGLTPPQAVRQYEDEDHAWIGVSLDRIRDGWVSRVTVVHAGYSAVHCQTRALRTTVQDCAMIDPISEHTGGRKYCFGANGQFGLFLRCYARNGRHDFVLGNRLAGPNTFLDCLADEASSASEPHHRYGTGGLWDNVRLRGDAELQAINRGDSGSGHGWAGANNVFWNCAAAVVLVMQPPTAQNYAIGWSGATDAATLQVAARFGERLRRIGERGGVTFALPPQPILGDGHIESPTALVAPRSLYLRQLQDRLGPAAVAVVTAPTPGPVIE